MTLVYNYIVERSMNFIESKFEHRHAQIVTILRSNFVFDIAITLIVSILIICSLVRLQTLRDRNVGRRTLVNLHILNFLRVININRGVRLVHAV